jgi:hypothetical protein
MKASLRFTSIHHVKPSEGLASPASLRSIFSNQNSMKTLLNLTMILALALPFMARAQTATDDIKVGSLLTSSGIKMQGFIAKSFPLPSGNWEVLSRLDEEYQLSNRDGEMPPSPKVILTLVNKDLSGSVAAAIITYSPEVVRIRWSNSSCEAPANGFADTAGTTAGTLDYVCVSVTYNKTGFKQLIGNSFNSTNAWTRRVMPSLIPFVAGLPNAYVWVNLTSNQDRGRTYNMTLLARSSANMVIGDSFDQSVRLWANAAGKALIAAHNGDAGAIAKFPSVEK